MGRIDGSHSHCRGIGGDVMSGKSAVICPPDCPNRCAQPNCHNVETCPTWAEYVARSEALRTARQRVRAAEDDVATVRHRSGRAKYE